MDQLQQQRIRNENATEITNEEMQMQMLYENSCTHNPRNQKFDYFQVLYMDTIPVLR